jgi:hypothetical protein
MQFDLSATDHCTRFVHCNQEALPLDSQWVDARLSDEGSYFCLVAFYGGADGIHGRLVSSDSIDISDKSPSEYFPQYAACFTQQELDEMMYWHALPKGWEEMEYPEFLETRRRGIARIIRDGFLKLSETLDE